MMASRGWPSCRRAIEIAQIGRPPRNWWCHRGDQRSSHGAGWGIGAAFFAQQAIPWKNRRQAFSDGGVTPAVAVGDQAAVGLHRAGDLTKVSPLALSNPINQRMQGGPMGPSWVGRHQSSSKASRSPKARCTRCWNRVVSPAATTNLPTAIPPPESQTRWHRPRRCLGRRTHHQTG